MIQGTDEWKLARLGKATASRMGDVTAKTKTGYSTTRANYMAELITERLTGVPFEGYTSKTMQDGRDREPAARLAYEFEHNVDVEQCGFFDHPTIAMTGASPDGLIGKDGMVEIKCPLSATHIDTLRRGAASIDKRYFVQMQWQMACAKRQWCDWISYCPHMPSEMQLFVARVRRDEETIKWLSQEVIQFLKELDEEVQSLVKMYGKRSAA